MEATARRFYSSSNWLKSFDIDKFCEVWTNLLNSGSGVIFALFVDGEIAGAIGGATHRDLYSSAMVAAELFWFVRPEDRGYGLKLYRAFEAWARESGCSEMRMAFLTDSMPEKVEATYKRLGFHQIERLYVKELPCAA